MCLVFLSLSLCFSTFLSQFCWCLLVLPTVLVICFDNPSFPPLSWLSPALASLCFACIHWSPVPVFPYSLLFHFLPIIFLPNSLCMSISAHILRVLALPPQGLFCLFLDHCLVSVPFLSLLPPISLLSPSLFHFIFLPVHRLLDDLFKIRNISSAIMWTLSFKNVTKSNFL